MLDALEGGRLVHLDVWAATVGGPCLSGSGAYGHTIAVAPEKSGTKWLVADPWCSPAKWVWWEESRLRSGAEEWGRRVLSTATGGLPPVGSAEWRVRVALLAKVLMSRWNPDHPAPDPGDSPDTGGAQSVLFTVTAAHEDDDMPTLYSVGAVYRTLPVGTRVFDKPGGSQVGSISNASTVYRLTAKEAKGTPSWYLIDGGGVDGVMRWVYAGDLD